MSSTMPWTIKIETTQGCNRSCGFCPVPSIYGKRYNFLSIETTSRIVDQLLDWSADRKWRFELAMLGEPTMNKNLPEIIGQIRRITKAQITVFTNGDIIKVTRPLIGKMYKAGLNVLAVDCYDNENLKFFEEFSMGGVTKWNYFDDDYKLYATKPGGWKLADLVIINDLATTQDLGSVRQMHNYGGNVNNERFGIKEITEPLETGCEKPFRDLVISHLGDVLVCCLDANKDLKLGNINDQSLKNIWYGEKFMDIRRSLAQKQRIGKPCASCNWHGGFKRFLAVNDFKHLL